MAYIGKSPDGTGVRSRFYYTQTSGGGTSISGTDDNSKTLTFTDGEYIDVFLNGVLLVAGTDYNTNTANTISGLAALANGDVVEVVVYDIFTVADTVSASAGGTFSANVAITGDLTVDTSTLKVDSTNNRVGVGDASPPTELTLGSGTFTVKNASGDSNGLKILQDTSDTSKIINHFGGPMVFGTNNTERMRIESGGDVGIGITNPSYRLATVEGTGIQNSDLSSSTSAAVLANIHPSIAGESLGSNSVNDVRNLGFGAIYVPSTTGTKPTTYGAIRVFEHYNGSSGKGSAFITQVAFGHATNPAIYARNSDTTNGSTLGTWYSFDLTSTSDERSKENVEDAPAQLALVNQFQVKEFDYIDNDDEPRQLGLMAQHVDTIAPEYVVKDPDDTDIMWRVKYNKMVPMLIKALQETTARIETLETENSTQATQIADLETRVTALEDA